MALSQLGVIAPYQDDVALSNEYVHVSQVIFEPEPYSELKSNDYGGVIANALTMVGDRAHRRGANVIAAFHYADALALNYDLGARLGIAQCLERVASLASGRGKPMHAAWFLGSAAAIRHAIGALHLPAEELDLRATITAVRAYLDEDAFAAAWMTGAALAQEKVITEALAFLLNSASTVDELPAQGQHMLPAHEPLLTSFDLTRREREVLRLLCQSLSDAEIGDLLYIGVRTVEFHVANMLRKLNVENRHDAADIAAQHGLI